MKFIFGFLFLFCAVFYSISYQGYPLYDQSNPEIVFIWGETSIQESMRFQSFNESNEFQVLSVLQDERGHFLFSENPAKCPVNKLFVVATSKLNWVIQNYRYQHSTSLSVEQPERKSLKEGIENSIWQFVKKIILPLRKFIKKIAF